MIPRLFGKTTPPKAPSRGALTAFGSAALFFGLVAGGPVIAQALSPQEPVATEQAITANWAIDYDASDITFSGTHDGNTFTGTFENWTANIVWDETSLIDNAVTVAVETGSAQTGTALYDNTVDAAEWFNTGAFPQASVTLSNFTATGESFTSDAAITLKDTTVTVPFLFTLTIEGDEATMTGTTQMSRQAFNLGQDSDASGDWVSLEIDVAINVQASRITP